MTTAVTLSLLVPLGLVVLILLVVVILAQHRDESDPTGRRPYAAYLFFVTFLALFTVLFAVFALVSSLMHIAVSDDSGVRAVSRQSFTFGNGTTQSFSAQGGEIGQSDNGNPTPRLSERGADDPHIRGAVRAGIVGVVAGAVLLFHVGRARELADELLLEGSPAVRVYHAYLYAVCAFAVIVGVGGAVAVGYSLFRIIAPGVASGSGVGKRSAGLPDLVSGAALTAGAVAIFLYHWRRSPGSLTRALPGGPPPPPELEPTPPPPPPPRRATTRRPPRAE